MANNMANKRLIFQMFGYIQSCTTQYKLTKSIHINLK